MLCHLAKSLAGLFGQEEPKALFHVWVGLQTLLYVGKLTVWTSSCMIRQGQWPGIPASAKADDVLINWVRTLSGLCCGAVM